MKLRLSSNTFRTFGEYKTMFIGGAKVVTLFVAALYLLGFTLFPLLGVGNYQLVRMDDLLFAEWIMLFCLSAVMFYWSFHFYVKLSRELVKRD